MPGPLVDMTVLEFASLGPGPFAGMMLADFGADVVRIDRVDAVDPPPTRADARGRHTLALDLKDSHAVAVCRRLAARADVVIEGHRPGVMERLGLGPEALLACNPALVYGRMTGWGQSGPLASTAGHDINYLAVSGALHAIGTPEKPIPPLNLGADYGGGAMVLLFGLLAAVHHARRTGEGQIVDAAMVDGTASLMSMFYGMHSHGGWSDVRGTNLLDGGAPFYDTYRCADDAWIAVGALEPKFFALLVEHIGADPNLVARQYDRSAWPGMRRAFEAIFRTRTQRAWCALLEHTDACFAPVLTLADAPQHPHLAARQVFAKNGAQVIPQPAPRLSRTPAIVPAPPRPIERDVDKVLHRWEQKTKKRGGSTF